MLTLHPFSNRILLLRMTGGQLLRVLEQQWPADPAAIPRILKTSGLYYAWDPARPAGSHVVRACDGQHRLLRADATYHVAVNDFLVGGGDGFTGFGGLPVEQVGPLDSDALESYLKTLHGAVGVPGPRIFVNDTQALRCSSDGPQPTSSP